MNLLTFLGTGGYKPARYVWNGQERLTTMAPAASCAFLEPQRLTVFVTGDSLPKYDELLAELEKLPQPRPQVSVVPTPKGKDESELWEIFELIADQAAPRSQAAFDVTHGLRSFPLLALLAAAFLRSALQVDLRAVLYGAYDAGEPMADGVSRVPMFDLTPMLSLLEWSAAAERFTLTGDAGGLGGLLRRQRKALALQAGGDPKEEELVGRLSNLGGALEGISQALMLIRPCDALEQCAGLPQRTEAARPLLERAPATRPYLRLLDQVQSVFAPLGLPEPRLPRNLRKALEKQRLALDWYCERRHWAQAATLGREWLLSWAMLRQGRDGVYCRAEREAAEKDLNALAKDYLACRQKKQPFAPAEPPALPQLEEALELWNALTDARNDLNHAGMREGPRTAKDLADQIQELIKRLGRLPLEENA